MRAILVLWLLFASFVGPSGARAQETGGSFGGGDWGDDDSAGSGGGGGSDWGAGSGGGGGGSSFGGSSGSGSAFGSGSRRDRDWGTRPGGGSAFGSSGRSRDSDGAGYGLGRGGSSRRSHGGCSGPTLPPWGCPAIGFVLLGWVFLALLAGLRRARARAQELDDVSYGVGMLEVGRAAVARTWPEAGPPLRARMVAGVDVSAISLAIDWRERERLQARLGQLARSGRTGGTGGLAALLHETVVELRRVQHAWLYAGAVNAAPAPKQEARATFSRVAQDMRSRFRRELVRAADGELVTDAPPELRAKALEGPGVVVVTVVVAARGDIPDVANARDGEHLRMLMRALGAIDAATLVALEVIWSPAAEDDRMSTVELEALYPELHKIDPASLGGRVFCGYCGFPHPAELLRCPECGAPTQAATVA